MARATAAPHAALSRRSTCGPSVHSWLSAIKHGYQRCEWSDEDELAPQQSLGVLAPLGCCLAHRNLSSAPEAKQSGPMLQRRKDVHLKLALALDISDSMNGTPDGASASTLHIVLDCMEQICSCPFLRGTDELSIVTFNHDVNTAWQGTLQSLDWVQFRRSTSASGNTAARDGVLRALRLLQDATIAEIPAAAEPGKVVINYLLAFTDGGDNSSKTSVHSLLEELRHPRLSHFHFMTIAAGLCSKDRNDWAALCSCPNGDMVVVRSASELQLREAFKAVLTQVRNLVVLDDDAMGQLTCRG